MIYRVPPFELQRIVRVQRRECLGDGRVRFHLASVTPGDYAPEPVEAVECEPNFCFLQHDVPLYDGRGTPNDGIYRARPEDGFWLVNLPG